MGDESGGGFEQSLAWEPVLWGIIFSRALTITLNLQQRSGPQGRKAVRCAAPGRAQGAQHPPPPILEPISATPCTFPPAAALGQAAPGPNACPFSAPQVYAPERDQHAKSAAAALGPAASYLCAPEAHGNAPAPPRGTLASRWGGQRAEGQGQGRSAREEERRKTEAEKAEAGRGRKTTRQEAERELPTTSHVW